MKLTDKQKADLKRHVDSAGGSMTFKRQHRMLMMQRMMKGMSVKKAHSDIEKNYKISKAGFTRK